MLQSTCSGLVSICQISFMMAEEHLVEVDAVYRYESTSACSENFV